MRGEAGCVLEVAHPERLALIALPVRLGQSLAVR